MKQIIPAPGFYARYMAEVDLTDVDLEDEEDDGEPVYELRPLVGWMYTPEATAETFAVVGLVVEGADVVRATEIPDFDSYVHESESGNIAYDPFSFFSVTD